MLYKKILVWEKSHQLTLEVYKLTKLFPKDELFGIVSQIRRASSSVPANIVEGNSRGSTKEFKRFLFQARGSLTETVYFLELSKDLNYICENDFERLYNLATEVGKMLNSLITKLKEKLN